MASPADFNLIARDKPINFGHDSAPDNSLAAYQRWLDAVAAREVFDDSCLKASPREAFFSADFPLELTNIRT